MHTSAELAADGTGTLKSAPAVALNVGEAGAQDILASGYLLLQ